MQYRFKFFCWLKLLDNSITDKISWNSLKIQWNKAVDLHTYQEGLLTLAKRSSMKKNRYEFLQVKNWDKFDKETLIDIEKEKGSFRGPRDEIPKVGGSNRLIWIPSFKIRLYEFLFRNCT